MNRKVRYSRKNFIFIAVAFFFSLFFDFVALSLDESGGIANSNNIFRKITLSLTFPSINAGTGTYVLAILTGLYIFIYIAIVIYIGRIALFYKKKPYSVEYIGYYILAFLLCVFLSLGVGFLIQMPISVNEILLSLNYLGQTLFISILFFFILASTITAVISLFLNIKNIDQPFRFFKNLKDEDLYAEDVEETKPINDNLNPLPQTPTGAGQGTAVPGNGQPIKVEGSGYGLEGEEGVPEVFEREKVFPGLSNIDTQYGGLVKESAPSIEINLEQLCVRFRNYLAEKEELYFDISTIRTFISAFSASRLIILEGLSGTGKSSLPRYFAKFLSLHAFFVPVQATWRDKSNLLGFFNDFSKTYNETEFLKRLYEASYTKNDINIMVLDEINISRIEYYFADFLSVLEYPSDARRLPIMQLPYGFIPPVNLQEGILDIPENTFFVGTANKDDSTYTITDKVYDRAITIDFDDRNIPFKADGDSEPITLTYEDFSSKIGKAKAVKENGMSEADYAKFRKVCDFTYETFDITFGNRIMNQIDNFVPTYVACGGSKEEALDFMFSRKILSKVQGRFEDYIKSGLLDLKTLLGSTYGKGVFKRSEQAIDKLVKKL
jgi:hypothetical protein